ncbi:MAG: acyl-ACP--UDP-N-acetylglucosamine O-acyltransferase [Opitutaceae bacterium]|jgi:UDP-N-acetylglucosamine acyltransferase
MIHPTAIIESGAQIGADCEIHAYAVITRHTVLGDRVVVHPFAVIGGDPQYLKFDPAISSFAKIGSGTTIREHVTVNRSIHAGKATSIGEDCFIMQGAHVGHDCEVGSNVVLANQALLAGHVSVGNHAFIGGNASIHQFVRIGESVMLGGLARITRDIAPFTMAAERDEVSGLNLVGIKRRDFPRETIRELKDAFREVYFAKGNIRELAAKALADGRYTTAEARRFLAFFSGGKRGFARTGRASKITESD